MKRCAVVKNNLVQNFIPRPTAANKPASGRPFGILGTKKSSGKGIVSAVTLAAHAGFYSIVIELMFDPGCRRGRDRLLSVAR